VGGFHFLRPRQADNRGRDAVSVADSPEEGVVVRHPKRVLCLQFACLLSVAVGVLLIGVLLTRQPAEAQQAEADALPPRVISTVPATGATNVDPNLTEITVKFDQPMTDGGWSWMVLRACGLYPGLRGGPGPSFDETKTTCSLPVKLQAGKVYAIGINSFRHSGFRSATGKVAVNFGWAFATGDLPPEALPPRVLEVDPPNGATDVDFRLTQISVTFDRPMKNDSWSWVYQNNSGVYPGYRGSPPPKFDDQGLTCTLPVKLSPNTVYALSLNSYRHTGFKDLAGKAALPYGWTFRTKP